MRKRKSSNNLLIDTILEHNLEHLKTTHTKMNRRERRAADKARKLDIKRQEEERNAQRNQN